MGAQDQIEHKTESAGGDAHPVDARVHLAQTALSDKEAPAVLNKNSDTASARMVSNNVLPDFALEHPAPKPEATPFGLAAQDHPVRPVAENKSELPNAAGTATGERTLDDFGLKSTKKLEGGTVVKTWDDGSQEFRYPDNTRYRHDANGNETFTDAKGNITVKYRDGERMSCTTDGVITRYHKDGSVERETELGQDQPKLYEKWNADGSSSKRLPNGIEQRWDKDGTYTIKSSENTITLRNGEMTIKATPDHGIESDEIKLKGAKLADGTVSYTSEDGELEIKHTPDGSFHISFKDDMMPQTTTLRPDGTLEQTSGDGSSTKTQPDGSVIYKAPPGDEDLRSVHIWPNGKYVAEKPDGGKEICNPDGTVQVVSPDGKTETKKIEVKVDDQEVQSIKQVGRAVEIELKDGTVGVVTSDDSGKLVLSVDEDKELPIAGDAWSMQHLNDRARFAQEVPTEPPSVNANPGASSSAQGDKVG